MPTYKGFGGETMPRGGKAVYVDGVPLDPRNDLRNHSPDGFSWGYGGSGPAQLALAILARHFRSRENGDELACEIYQQFKWLATARLPIDLDWTLTSAEIDSLVAPLMPRSQTEE